MEETFTTKKELEKIDKKLDRIATKEDIKNLNKQLSSISDDLKMANKLETRVLDIENVLNMPAKKN